MIRRKFQPEFNIAVANECSISIIFSGREKECYSIVANINGECTPIRFGSTDQTVLYLATLFCASQGNALRKSVFRRRSNMNSPEKLILRKLFYRVKFTKEFEEWFAKITENDAHRVNDAKSKVNKIIEKALSESHPEICSLFKIECENSRGNGSCYKVGLSPEMIFFSNSNGQGWY